MSVLFILLFIVSFLLGMGLIVWRLINIYRKKPTEIKGISFGKLIIGTAIVFVISIIGATATNQSTSSSAEIKTVVAITKKQRQAVSTDKVDEKERSADLAKKYLAAKAASESLATIQSSIAEKDAAAVSISELASSKASVASEEAVSRSAAASSSQAAAQALSLANSQSASTAAASRQAAATAAAASAPATSAPTNNGDVVTGKQGTIIGNINSKIYHVPGQAGYHINSANARYFNTEQEAINAGYRKALR